jgi:hypothetical protein
LSFGDGTGSLEVKLFKISVNSDEISNVKFWILLSETVTFKDIAATAPAFVVFTVDPYLSDTI